MQPSYATNGNRMLPSAPLTLACSRVQGGEISDDAGEFELDDDDEDEEDDDFDGEEDSDDDDDDEEPPSE